MIGDDRIYPNMLESHDSIANPKRLGYFDVFCASNSGILFNQQENIRKPKGEGRLCPNFSPTEVAQKKLRREE